MTRRPYSLLPLLVAGCATAPVSLSISTPAPMDDLYTCAMLQLTRLEYTVDNTDRGSGIIQARKRTLGNRTSLFSGQIYYSTMTVAVLDHAMTVAILDEPTAGDSTFRVTVGRIGQDTWGWDQGTESLEKPSVEAESEARQLIAACAPSAAEPATF